MAEFACEVVQIDEVIRHPNADTLTICKIRGFNCITSDVEPGVARYNKGDYVVYIPEAAVLPDWILKKLGFWDETNQCGTLSGSRKNRVKIIKLRGEYSQGIMFPVSYMRSIISPNHWALRVENDNIVHIGNTDNDSPLGKDVSELLGITKYEPAVPQQMAGVVGALFGFTKSYDIENMQNFPNVFQDGEEVVVTEKLHGTLCQIGFLTDLPEDKRDIAYDCGHGVYAYVTSKGMAKQGFVQKQIEGNKDNVYVKTFDKYFAKTGLAQKLADDLARFSARLGEPMRSYVFGEIMGPGIQSGFTYNKKTPELRIFDVFHEKQYLSDYYLDKFCVDSNIPRVPVLYKGPFSMAKMIELRDGKTVEGNGIHIREGIVIKPVKEVQGVVHRGLHDNRKQLKFVSPAYKMKEDENAIQ